MALKNCYKNGLLPKHLRMYLSSKPLKRTAQIPFLLKPKMVYHGKDGTIFVSAYFTLFWCTDSMYITSINDEKFMLRYIVKLQLKDDENMEMVTTEHSRNDAVEVISNNFMLKAHVRKLLTDPENSSKCMAKKYIL